MRYKITHTTVYSYSDIVPVCHNELRVTPRDGLSQQCSHHRLIIKPKPVNISRRLDYFGNPCHQFSVQEGHKRLNVTAISRVSVKRVDLPALSATRPWEAVRDQVPLDFSATGLDAMQYVFDSPAVIVNPVLREFTASSFPAGRPILAGVFDLLQRIHREFVYDPQATTVNTPIDEVFSLRRGVCQDFAHLTIGGLRSLGLPARYVSGYLRTLPPPGRPRLVGADASHAWLSVYCGEHGWVDADPTNQCFPADDHVTVAWGRDYTDVCPIKGVFLGGGSHTMRVSVDVLPLTNGTASEDNDGTAPDDDD